MSTTTENRYDHAGKILQIFERIEQKNKTINAFKLFYIIIATERRREMTN